MKLLETKQGKQCFQDVDRRRMMGAMLSLFCNVAYALYHGALGVIMGSVWFGAMCVYYLILSVMRTSAVICLKRETSPARARAVRRSLGGLLAFLALLLTAIIYIALSQNTAAKYGTITMITIATYTFTKLILAIVRAAKHRRDTSDLYMILRNTGYAEVSVSILTMQRSMLISFDGGTMDAQNALLLNVMTGAAVCMFIFLRGIALIKKSGAQRASKENKTKGNEIR